jgi:hypothetical protein
MIRSSLVALLVSHLAAFAGEEKAVVRQEVEPRSRLFTLFESAYGFEADYERGGSGSAWEIYGSAGAVIPWKNAPLPGNDLGQWQWRLGAAYQRFEFDHDSLLPLPDRLQSISAIIALEFLVNDQIAALLDIRPGAYFEDDVSEQSFDIPVRLGFGYRVNDRFSLVGMARYRGFADNPVIGGVGFVWKMTDRLTLSAIYPEPRLTWRASDELGLWLGAEFAGGAYRVDREPGRGRRSGAVVDYSDKRVALGATWQRGSWKIEAAGGVSIEREWDYHRVGDRYETDEVSPFVKLGARLEF